MRLFLAINPTAEERARLGEATRALRESDFPVRWVSPESVHLTIKFLGEVHEERLAQIGEAVDAAVEGLGPFSMMVRRFGAFPSPRRPNVVWVGIGLGPSLAALQERVEEAMAALSFAREERRFRPHITLGRAQKRARSTEFERLDETLKRLSYEDEFHVRAVDVMRSRLRPAGATYDVLHSTELAS